MAKITIDVTELKRLRVFEMLLKFAERHRLSAGQLSEIARLVANDPRVLLDSDGAMLASEFINEDSADQLRGSKDYLFTPQQDDDAPAEELFAGKYSREQLSKMSSAQKLAAANEEIEIERKRKNAKG